MGEETEAAGYGSFAAMLMGAGGGWLQRFSITRLKVLLFVTLGGLQAFRGIAVPFG